MPVGILRKPGLASLAAFALLCLLWTTDLLRSDLFPGLFSGQFPPLEREAMAFALFAAPATLTARRRAPTRPSRNDLYASVRIGCELFILPAILLRLAEGYVPALARTALFTLVPVFAVVLQPHIGSHPRQPNRLALLAALAAASGALCVFPLQFPASVASSAAFVAVLLAAVSVASGSCRASASVTAPLAAILAATAALALAFASTLLEHPILTPAPLGPELLWSAVIELPALALLFRLLPRLSPVRLTTRYTLAPLLAVLLGAIAFRSPLAFRTILGLILLAAASIYLLLAPETGANPDPGTAPPTLFPKTSAN
jgi:drug/metabolite transporter (DMT)-like permease